MAEFKNFVTELQKRLNNNLPGKASQLKMAPITRLIELERERTIEEPRKSAVLVLFYPDNEKTKIIFIKRAIDQTVHSGQISFPGGKHEKSDIDLKATALRETNEEIGLESKKITIIGSLSKLYIPPSNFDVYPFVGFLEQKPVFEANHEVQHVLKIDFEELCNPQACAEKTISHRTGKEVVVPSYYIQNEIIWGATAMMLSELLEITEGL